MKSVRQSKIIHFIYTFPLISQISKSFHKEAIAGGSAERIHHKDLPVRISFRQDIFGNHGGINRATQS